jgi:palmitoyltransferase
VFCVKSEGPSLTKAYQFFLIFVFWSALYCLFVLGSLVGLNAAAAVHHAPDFAVDPQHIVAIALCVFSLPPAPCTPVRSHITTRSAGLFALFTLSLEAMHAVLVLLNMTTVEQLGIRSTKERESEKLARLYGCWQIRCVLPPLLAPSSLPGC